MGKNIILWGSLAVVGVIIAIIYIFSGNNSAPAMPAPSATTTPTTADAPARNPLVFGSLGPGVYERAVEPKKQKTETFSLSGQGQAILKIETKDPKVSVTLKDANNNSVKNISPTKTTFIFQVATDNGAGNKDWQLIVNNPNINKPANYNLTISEAPQISANSNAGDANNVVTGTANLSLILEETVSLNVTVPVINAAVVATITDPHGQTSTVTLIENPNIPGTYTGTFNDVSIPGVYEITYTISGENAAGQHFDQVVTDQFIVPAPSPNPTPNEPNPTYQSTKKFDINQSGDIRPIY